MSLSPVQKLRQEAGALHLFASLIAAGVPILETIQLVGDAYEEFKPAMTALREAVSSGTSLRDGLKGHEASFSPLVPSLIDIGEECGSLDEVLFSAAQMVKNFANLINAGQHLDVPAVLNATDFEMLATLIEVGLPLARSLRIIGAASSSPNSEVFTRLATCVEGGDSLSVAMKRHPDKFSSYMMVMVQAGEMGGILDITLRQLADHLLWNLLDLDTSGVRPAAKEPE